MHNPILLTAICAVVSFFIGAIPFGLILGRVFNHTDIRKAGSGNIGTTNALRVAGPKVAALTLLFDCLKGAICVLIARPLIASVGYGFPVSISRCCWRLDARRHLPGCRVGTHLFSLP